MGRFENNEIGHVLKQAIFNLLDGLELHVFVPIADPGPVGVAGPALELLRRILHLVFGLVLSLSRASHLLTSPEDERVVIYLLLGLKLCSLYDFQISSPTLL